MAEQARTLLETIDRKIRDIHRERVSLREENLRLKENLEQFESELKARDKSISELESKLETLRLAKAYQGDASEGHVDKEARGKINEMVREIDRCIALLND